MPFLTLYLDSNFVNDLINNSSCQLLTNDTVKKIFVIKGKMYVCTGGSNKSVSIIECVHFEKYTGDSYSYDEKRDLVYKGKLSRGYDKQKFSFNGKKYVCVGNIIFVEPVEIYKQLDLF